MAGIYVASVWTGTRTLKEEFDDETAARAQVEAYGRGHVTRYAHDGLEYTAVSMAIYENGLWTKHEYHPAKE